MNNIEIIKKYVNDYKLNVLPTRKKEKAPGMTTWKQFENRLITEKEIENNFQNIDFEVTRIGIVCGKISGALEVLDFDNKLSNAEDIIKEFRNMPEVEDIISKCPIETTQNGGYHIYYRCSEIQGNLKLAMEPNGLDEKGNQNYECTIETRGEGGFIVCAPSKGYELIQGDFSEIPNITPDERELLFSAAKSFDKIDKKPTQKFSGNKGNRPWELFDADEDSIALVKKLLVENGWKQLYTRNDRDYWSRPGKNSVSATFKGNGFYVFTSSAYPFEPNRYYKPSGIYALLKHGNEIDDFKKAVKDFVAMGYESGNNGKSEIFTVEQFLSENYSFRNNVITGRLEMKGIQETDYYDVEDFHLSSIYRELQHREINFSFDKLNLLLSSNFVDRYDPFQEYFQGLPVWDGVDYIEQLSETITLTDESKREYWYKCLRRFLIALTACATIPTQTNEVSIIFYGSQGEGKTKWLNRLVPEALASNYLYVGNVYDDKDSKINLSTKLLINLDELGSLHREEIGYLKSMFSIESISVREPYMRKARNFIRRASFVGSIDREEFLSDLAGTRRFLSFSVKSVDYLHIVNMDLVYAQAFSLLKAGEKYYFDKTEIDEIEKNNEEFKTKGFEEGLLFEHFSIPTGAAKVAAMTSTEIATVFAGVSTSYRVNDASIRKIGQIMKKYGFQKKAVLRNGVSTKCWLVEKKTIVPFNYQSQSNFMVTDN